VPLLNAAGRFRKAEISAEILLTESEDRAWELAGSLKALNSKRKTLQRINKPTSKLKRNPSKLISHL
jgi:single-stranded DNA-specific DHH superfamily exonuclease